jgi:hypothetical protein
VPGAILAATVAAALGGVPGAVAASETTDVSCPAWRKLANPQAVWPGNGAPDALYYSFDLADGSKVHLVVVDTKSGKWLLKIGMAQKTRTTSKQGAAAGASAAVNAGYFNMTDGVSASYVVIADKEVGNPRCNQALIANPRLIPHLEKIFARSEIRFMQDGRGKRKIVIVPHNRAIGKGEKILESLQAGPQLLPTVTAREEAFLRIDPDGRAADSIGVSKPAARTAFGVTPDGFAMLVTVAGKGQDPESSGITIENLAKLMRDLGCSSAINLDGGASSTMFVKLKDARSAAKKPPPGEVVCGRMPETLVKSVLLLIPAK